jgi:hypothetical protein
MDVSSALSEITSAGTSAATVGIAVLAVLGVVFGYRLIRRAFS